jgi:hypothetical protein
MTKYTPNLRLPYPEAADPPRGADQMEALATAVDAVLAQGGTVDLTGDALTPDVQMEVAEITVAAVSYNRLLQVHLSSTFTVAEPAPPNAWVLSVGLFVGDTAIGSGSAQESPAGIRTVFVAGSGVVDLPAGQTVKVSAQAYVSGAFRPVHADDGSRLWYTALPATGLSKATPSPARLGPSTLTNLRDQVLSL